MSLEERKEKLDAINRKLKRKKFMLILFALFTLGVNAFAWFVFSTHTGFDIQANVLSWDIRLTENDEEIDKDVTLNVDMYPGMPTYVRKYELHNLGEVDANFTYELEGITLFGEEVSLEEEDPYEYLKNYYPFTIYFEDVSNDLKVQQKADFSINVGWDFDDPTAYYPVKAIYEYDPDFDYYSRDRHAFVQTEVTEEEYEDMKAVLYITRDDADSYFGMKCAQYKESTGKSCLTIKLKLIVSQIE